MAGQFNIEWMQNAGKNNQIHCNALNTNVIFKEIIDI